jgi:hypothetical protein
MTLDMQRFARLAATALAVASAVPAVAATKQANPPYLKLAVALGTPSLAHAEAAPGKTQMLLTFVRSGETVERWTKMTTVSILQLPSRAASPAETFTATRGVIHRLRARLTAAHARVATFAENDGAPASAYFDVVESGEHQVGIVYSPDPGYVTVAELGVRAGGAIAAGDVAKLRSLIGK